MTNNLYITVQRALISFLLVCYLFESAPQSYLITRLPGFNGRFPSKHYSGYVTIDDHQTKHLFYYFAESERTPSEDPLVLWLGGESTCSTFGAFIYQHGPFEFKPSGPFNLKEPNTKGDLPKLIPNPNSWSKVSNIIYLESPLGVGLSYSLNRSDDSTGDFQTASNTHSFLLKWFGMFPEFKNNPFYIAGESDAGISVPTLASEIMKGIESGLKPTINLKGYLIGNGVSGEDFDGKAYFRFTHMMGMISDDLYEKLLKFCGENFYAMKPGKECMDARVKYGDAFTSIDTTNLMAPCHDVDYNSEYLCHNCIDGDDPLGSNNSGLGMSRYGDMERSLPVRKMILDQHRPRNGLDSTESPVVSNRTALGIQCNKDMVGFIWLNNEEVRKEIHAAEKNVSGRWEICNQTLTYRRDAGGMIKYHKRLTSLGLRVLIYSGDHDLVVPYIGSEAWIRSLNYKIIDEWRPWISKGQVAGYTQEYDKNLTFLTVKGAGHAVAEDKPRETLDFYRRWIAGKRV